MGCNLRSSQFRNKGMTGLNQSLIHIHTFNPLPPSFFYLPLRFNSDRKNNWGDLPPPQVTPMITTDPYNKKKSNPPDNLQSDFHNTNLTEVRTETPPHYAFISRTSWVARRVLLWSLDVCRTVWWMFLHCKTSINYSWYQHSTSAGIAMVSKPIILVQRLSWRSLLEQ